MRLRLGDTEAARSISHCVKTNSLSRLLYPFPVFTVFVIRLGTSAYRNRWFRLLRASETRNSFGLGISSVLGGIRCVGIDKNSAKARRSAITQDSTSMIATRRRNLGFRGECSQAAMSAGGQILGESKSVNIKTPHAARAVWLKPRAFRCR